MEINEASSIKELKGSSSLLSNLKLSFNLVVSISIDPIVEKEKIGSLMGVTPRF